MSYIIDRRLNGRNKSTVNRQRFLERYRQQIKEAVADAVNRRSITDMEHGESVAIPTRDISEPVFHHGQGGERELVHPGNREFTTGDRIKRPDGGGGGGSGEGKASDSGEGEDEFSFTLSQEEFLNFLFDDLELPNLVKRRLAGIETFQWQNAGIVNDGNPAKINIVRSLRAATSRRIALGAGARKRLKEAEAELRQLLEQDASPERVARVAELREEIERLERRLERIPFIDTFDLRYNHHIKVPKPSSQAVMFCLMDVSGSMNQAMKDMGKRFFLLLYLFLKRNYKKIDVVFIRHHTSAKEVDEEEFFYSRETGGTIVSSALKLMKEIMAERYPADEWNIYGAQASDGDNWNDDSPLCRQLLDEDIMPLVQYFAYIEITPREHQALWQSYEGVMYQWPGVFAMQQIIEASDIYPVFRELFARKKA
ncbi:MAG TPA: YeaH/YhbH family protein [Moraxellaceae bacterium]|nr:YeaH/YhbH family protein [Moraxellaceae bacterium]